MDALRQDAVTLASAYACIHFHPQAYRDPQLLRHFWHGSGRPPTRKQLEVNVYRRGVLQRIQQGLDDSDLKPWTGGFWQGLKLSGALKNSPACHWRIGNGRPELIEDLSRLPFSGKLSKPDHRGRYRLYDCDALHLPPRDKNDITVLAGLFAGAKLRQTGDGRAYFAVADTAEVRATLDYWELAIYNRGFHGYGLSPFYAALLMEHMPVACAGRAFYNPRVVQCPMLPLAYWEVLFGPEGMPLPPRAWSLPFICADITRKRHKWTHRDLHRAAVQLGVPHVQPELQKLIVDWRRNREMLYNPDVMVV